MKKQSDSGMSRDDAQKAFEGTLTEKIVSPKQNIANRDNVMRNWSLGPEKTSVDPKANKPYWSNMADIWDVSEPEARRRFCSNCEYYNNTPDMQTQMESIPLDKYDMDGGGRGYCEKFDFICHSLRVCQAWEEKPFDTED